MKIAIGSDHGGFALKEKVVQYLKEQGHEVIDCGCYSSDRVDYPLYASKTCKVLQEGKAQYGVLVCTSGIGMSICANKMKGIRAAHVLNLDAAKFSRLHNNANVICLGAKYYDIDEAKEFIDMFLNTQFEGGRHIARVQMINDLDNK